MVISTNTLFTEYDNRPITYSDDVNDLQMFSRLNIGDILYTQNFLKTARYNQTDIRKYFSGKEQLFTKHIVVDKALVLYDFGKEEYLANTAIVVKNEDNSESLFYPIELLTKEELFKNIDRALSMHIEGFERQLFRNQKNTHLIEYKNAKNAKIALDMLKLLKQNLPKLLIY